MIRAASAVRQSGHLLGLAAVAVLLAGCAREQPAPEPVRAVRTATVAARPAETRSEHAAEIRARTELALAFQVPGRLRRRHVEAGDAVRAGQLNRRIDAGSDAVAGRGGKPMFR